MNTFDIRLADSRDVGTIARHRAEMFRDMGSLRDEHYDDLIRQTTDYLDRAIPSGDYVGWLACTADDPDVVAAGAGLQIRALIPRPAPGRAGLIAGRQGLIVNVFTERSYRRRGLARRLMESVLSWSRANELASVVLHASPDGRALYETLGFLPTNEMFHAGDLAGA